MICPKLPQASGHARRADAALTWGPSAGRQVPGGVHFLRAVPYHGLATGPDGQCALCHRGERTIRRARYRHDPVRTIAVVLVAIMAAVATFFLVGALLDTR